MLTGGNLERKMCRRCEKEVDTKDLRERIETYFSKHHGDDSLMKLSSEKGYQIGAYDVEWSLKAYFVRRPRDHGY
jgi:hypothetical protein